MKAKKSVGAPNPKDLVGATKIDLSLFPSAGILHGAHALVDGAVKYGPYNWRFYDVQAMTYIAAAQRHLAAFLDGENIAQDSGVHHLGHAMACCAILLDASEGGHLIDNRPPAGATPKLAARLNKIIKNKKPVYEDPARER
jgi:hypothetical protein